ncbi:MAG: HDOD domain-containing protein [Sedimentisphaerales bacterium]|nr:HDOD domain-containing protein [Sedimentisphaerales bacterium]
MSETRPIRLLFVDDDLNVLNGLRRMLYGMRGQWKMEFVHKAVDALKVMEATSYDVVISDLRMPDMDGIAFLQAVREKYPDTIRFMLSGYMDKALQTQAAQCVHQFISKPCDAEQLKVLVTRALALYNRLRSGNVTKILSRIESLPVMPEVYQEVIDMFHRPSCSLRQIGQAIAKDVGMSSKILQVVNTAFYGQETKIIDPVHAVSYLGQKAAEALIITSGVFGMLPNKKIRQFSIMGLQEHCIRVGALAREICKIHDLDEQEQETATMAGILHDAGKMVLILHFEEELVRAIAQSKQQGLPMHQIEQETLGVTHGELGGCLLDLWGLPNTIIEAVTYHHEPTHCVNQEFSVISAVHIADAVDREYCCEIGWGYPEVLDTKYVDQLGLADKIETWRRLHLPDLQEEPVHARS